MSMYTVFDCSVIELPKIENAVGNITPIHGLTNIPFEIRRVFYSYDIPGGEVRGAHAHKECHQLLIAASGSYEVVLDDGVNKRTILLNRPFYGLHILPGIWAYEQGFSSGSICLVLASNKYEADDYIRNYKEFVEYRQKKIECVVNDNYINGGVKPNIFKRRPRFIQFEREVA